MYVCMYVGLFYTFCKTQIVHKYKIVNESMVLKTQVYWKSDKSTYILCKNTSLEWYETVKEDFL